MEPERKDQIKRNSILLQSEELYKYILEGSVYPREAATLRELRAATANHPTAFFATAPDAGCLMAMLMKLVNARRTIEIGVFTGYSVLLTALTIPDDGKVLAIDIDRGSYEIGLPIIKKAGVEHKINFIQSQALPVLDKLLENKANEGSFDFAFVDADKNSYLNYHERLIKLVRVGGVVVYDNTLWGGTVAWPEERVPNDKKNVRLCTIQFNASISGDPRVEMCLAPMGDGITICRRVI